MDKVQKRNWLGWLLVTYLVMLTICLALSYYSNVDMISGIINGILFLIVGIVFSYCSKRFKLVNQLEHELQDAIKLIENDKNAVDGYLWEQYKADTTAHIFSKGIFHEAYERYVYEMKRMESLSKGKSKCRIDDYINVEQVDAIARKNLLNLVPGVMTGLGILGTFIGLTVGLQNFQTGSAAEISDSIAPLMDGIKIAFHTSIYGMVFSLVYNYIYKGVMEDCYTSLEQFLNKYSLYVVSDVENDNISALYNSLDELPSNIGTTIADSLLPTLKQVVIGVEELKKAIYQNPAEIGTQLAQCITPTLEKMSSSLDGFAEKISNNQVDMLSTLIDKFIIQMNDALGNSFKQLSLVINETSEMQRVNNEFLQNIFGKLSELSDNIIYINELSQNTVKSMSNYIEQVENLQRVINENMVRINANIDAQKESNEKFQTYIASLVEYEGRITESSEKYTEGLMQQLDQLGEVRDEMTKVANNSITTITELAMQQNAAVAQAAKQELSEVYETADKLSKDMSTNMMQQLGLFEQTSNQYSEMMTEGLKTFKESAVHSNNEVSKNAIEHVNASIKYSQLVAEQAMKHNMEIAEAAKQQINSINISTEKLTEGIRTSAKELMNAISTVDADFSKSLKRTFESFDEALSSIANHLSATISKVDATTGRVPRTVEEAYVGMQKAFEEMQKNIEALSNSVSMDVNKLEESTNPRRKWFTN